MKELFKAFVYLVFTAAVVIGGYVLAGYTTKDIVYSGTTIRFSTDSDRDIFIVADNVQFEAASSGFFVLRKVSGETIVPVPAIPPLGWTADSYYNVAPTEIPGGKWLTEVGNPYIQITSINPINISAVMTTTRKQQLDGVVGILGILVWAVGLAVLEGTGFSRWGNVKR